MSSWICRKQCIQTCNVFDFLKDTVSKVPDLGGSAATGDDQAVTKRRYVFVTAPAPISCASSVICILICILYIRKVSEDDDDDSDEETKRSKMVI
jgi:hypothetical protein